MVTGNPESVVKLRGNKTRPAGACNTHEPLTDSLVLPKETAVNQHTRTLPTPTTRYRDEPGLTCTNVYCREDRLGYVFFFDGLIPEFPERSNRWYFHTSHLLPRGVDHSQPDNGYATFDDARQALIAVWEARV